MSGGASLLPFSSSSHYLSVSSSTATTPHRTLAGEVGGTLGCPTSCSSRSFFNPASSYPSTPPVSTRNLISSSSGSFPSAVNPPPLHPGHATEQQRPPAAKPAPSYSPFTDPSSDFSSSLSTPPEVVPFSPESLVGAFVHLPDAVIPRKSCVQTRSCPSAPFVSPPSGSTCKPFPLPQGQASSVVCPSDRGLSSFWSHAPPFYLVILAVSPLVHTGPPLSSLSSSPSVLSSSHPSPPPVATTAHGESTVTPQLSVDEDSTTSPVSLPSFSSGAPSCPASCCSLPAPSSGASCGRKGMEGILISPEQLNTCLSLTSSFVYAAAAHCCARLGCPPGCIYTEHSNEVFLLYVPALLFAQQVSTVTGLSASHPAASDGVKGRKISSDTRGASSERGEDRISPTAAAKVPRECKSRKAPCSGTPFSSSSPMSLQSFPASAFPGSTRRYKTRISVEGSISGTRACGEGSTHVACAAGVYTPQHWPQCPPRRVTRLRQIGCVSLSGSNTTSAYCSEGMDSFASGYSPWGESSPGRKEACPHVAPPFGGGGVSSSCLQWPDRGQEQGWVSSQHQRTSLPDGLILPWTFPRILSLSSPPCSRLLSLLVHLLPPPYASAWPPLTLLFPRSIGRVVPETGNLSGSCFVCLGYVYAMSVCGHFGTVRSAQFRAASVCTSLLLFVDVDGWGMHLWRETEPCSGLMDLALRIELSLPRAYGSLGVRGKLSKQDERAGCPERKKERRRKHIEEGVVGFKKKRRTSASQGEEHSFGREGGEMGVAGRKPAATESTKRCERKQERQKRRKGRSVSPDLPSPACVRGSDYNTSEDWEIRVAVLEIDDRKRDTSTVSSLDCGLTDASPFSAIPRQHVLFFYCRSPATPSRSYHESSAPHDLGERPSSGGLPPQFATCVGRDDGPQVFSPAPAGRKKSASFFSSDKEASSRGWFVGAFLVDGLARGAMGQPVAQQVAGPPQIPFDAAGLNVVEIEEIELCEVALMSKGRTRRKKDVRTVEMTGNPS